ncbi:MAG TPA: hypothetical protein VJW20_12865 [Candidatus Angelobacter sp.]|nr:hypothetical protein [Candidatus Angelobacter sp.]
MSKFVFWLGSCLIACQFLYAADSKLVLVGHPIIVIDPHCSNNGEGSVHAKLRNENAAGQPPIPVYLTSTDIVSNPAGKRVNGKVAVLPITSALEETPVDKRELASGQEMWVKITVTNVDQVGEWQTTLQNENVDLGPIRIVRNDVPFLIGLDTSTPDAPELTFVRNQPASFRLKNDSLTDYQVTWEYSIGNRTLRPTDLQELSAWDRLMCWLKKNCVQKPVGPPTVLVPSTGGTTVTFAVPSDWYENKFVGLFKDDAKDGHLLVRRVDKYDLSPAVNNGCSSSPATRVFKIKTHMPVFPGTRREILGDMVVFVVLLLGGLCSLILNFALPNQIRRLKLKEVIDTLERQVGDLSSDLASRLRVLVGLAQRLLKDRLRNLTWTNSDFTSEMQNIDKAATQLGTRIQFLNRLGATRSSFERLSPLVLPPSIIVGMEETFSRVVALGIKTEFGDADLQAAQGLIQILQDQMDSSGKSNAAWVTGLANRVKNLKTILDHANGSVGTTHTWKQISAKIPGAYKNLTTIDPAQIQENDYLFVDRTVFRLELLVTYVRQVEAMSATDPIRKRLSDIENKLADLLPKDSWDRLEEAVRLVKQVQEGHFKDDIQNALANHALIAKCKRILIMPFQPCVFTLEFSEDALNDAKARDEWTCKWVFNNNNEPPLSEEGWEVTHYFQRPETYTLHITVRHRMDTKLVFKLDRTKMEFPEIKVLPEGRRKFYLVIAALLKGNWSEARKEWRKSRTGANRVLEILWLILALFLALVGLMEGAKEQILKMDVIPAMIAIFLIGVGADQIKNLLTKKQD